MYVCVSVCVMVCIFIDVLRMMNMCEVFVFLYCNFFFSSDSVFNFFWFVIFVCFLNIGSDFWCLFICEGGVFFFLIL